MLFKKIACLAAISASAIAPLTYAGSAHAINISYSPGVFRTEGVTNEGAFAKNVNDPNYVTIDFNNADSSFNGNKLVKYSFSGGTPSTTINQQTGIISDEWAPAGVNGENNYSKYLAVFDNSSVSITAKNGGVFNYFGLDAGALSGGNTFELLKGGKTVAAWTYDQLNNLATVANAAQGNQKNGFFEFSSQGYNDNFDTIKLSQVGGGGFESDNHTFKIASGAYNAKSVPEPTAVIGLMAVGGMLLLKRKSQKSVNLG